MEAWTACMSTCTPCTSATPIIRSHNLSRCSINMLYIYLHTERDADVQLFLRCWKQLTLTLAPVQIHSVRAVRCSISCTSCAHDTRSRGSNVHHCYEHLEYPRPTTQSSTHYLPHLPHSSATAYRLETKLIYVCMCGFVYARSSTACEELCYFRISSSASITS